jgi:hypothetical protein
MSYVILERVQYRLPETSRLIWAIVLAQREGLTLLFVQKPDDQRSHTLVFATESTPQRVFHDVPASRFPLEREDLVAVGAKLTAIGEQFEEAEVKRFFRSENPW